MSKLRSVRIASLLRYVHEEQKLTMGLLDRRVADSDTGSVGDVLPLIVDSSTGRKVREASPKDLFAVLGH